MNSLAAKRGTILKTVFSAMILCAVMGFTNAAQAYDYRAKFIQECGWLATQQVSSGGIQEGEDYTTAVESDNTHEAVWIWSRYAELTGDYTTYQTRINNAWIYLNANPAWLEGGSVTNYYTTYNCAWGMLAEMKYRQVYSGKSGYVDHTAYGRRCASTLHQGNCGTSGSDGEACILGLAAGALYQYGVFDSNTVAQTDANTFGNTVRTWLNGNSANFSSEAWAVSGGAAVWGVLNSYYKVNPSGAAAWAETANTYMPLNAMNNVTNNYEFGMDGWYAWGHYALSQIRGADSFVKYNNVINKILASDNDHDGGTRQGLTYADTSDYAWATDIPQFAANYGLIGTTNYTISGTITSGGSPLAGVQMIGLPGTSLADANSWPVTDASGNYTAQVPAGFYGTVTPFKLGYSFSPATITYSNLSSNQTGQNYTASTSTYVSILGSWTTGTTHAKETGTNRALIFVAHAMGNSSTSSLTGVTYGTRAMTKITDQLIGSGSARAYVAAFILNDANITAATTTTFTPTWTSAPTNITYSSVFLQNVNQTTLVGANAKNGLTGVVSASTTPLVTSNGDMVIENAASSNTGTYLVPTGWTNDIDLSATGYDGMGGHKNAAGVNEMPTITQGTTASTRNHSIIGFVVKAAPVTITRRLTVSSSGNGTVTTPGIGDFNYSDGNVVNLVASANANYHFVNWTGTAVTAGKVASPTSASTTVTMDGDYTVVANFAIDQKALTTSATAGGTVTTPGIGSFNYNYGTAASIAATPNANYHFVNWTGTAVTAGKVASPTSASTIVTMDGDYTVTANFAINTFTLSYSAGANGTINGTSPQTVNYGANGTAVTAVPNTGYHFVNWSDASTANPRTDLNVTANITVTANFAINTFTLTYTAGANGTINGTSPQTVNYGANGTAVTAVPNTGYHFVNWSDTSTQNPRTDLNVTANIAVTANFAINTFTLTYTAGANGTLTGTSLQTVNYNASGSPVTAVPSTGYHFVNWSDTSTANPRTDLNVTANIAVTANFAINTFTLTYTAGANGSITGITPQTVNYNASGSPVTAVPNTGYHFVKWSDDSTANPRTDLSVTANIAVTANFAIDQYTVTASADSNGTVAPLSEVVNYNGSQLFTASPGTGYVVDKWMVDGNDVQTGGTTYTLSNITATHTVAVSFKILTYTVTASSGANGSIDPTGDITKDYGSSQLFTAMPTTGYEVDKWTVDGNDAQTGGTTYTLSSITATHTVAVSFKILTYTVTASADANGSIDPMGGITKDYGSSQLFTATPTTGYEVDKWMVDGNDVQTGGNTYTLENVTTIHTVAVTFSRIVFSISGYVVEIDGSTPVKDVLMSAGDTNTLTDANGYYELSVGYGWSGAITPEKQGYVFEPNSNTYNNITQGYNDVNYTAALMTFKIAGHVLDSGNSTPISNTSVSAENGGGPWTSKYGGGSSMTDASGYYEVMVDYNWSGKVTPAKYAYAFEPNGTTYENVNVDYTAGQDYAGTLLTFKISGYIMNKCSIPIKDVLVSADNGGGQAMTDANGYYEVWVSYAWTGTVTPTKNHYTFELGSGSYVSVLVDQAGQNYTANNIYDLDCDGSIDIGDVGVMADNWLITGPIPGDFDADGSVNFVDFAIFSNVWGD